MKLQDISKQIEIIEKSIAWANKFEKDAFPREIFKDYRRKVKKIKFSLEERCSAAAYGESQVGKSYLMSSLLSSPNSPFVITNGGRSYSFIDELNPSGGNIALKESTGVITRFTTRNNNDTMVNKVRIRTLSIVDIIMMLTDAYYNDIKIDADSALKTPGINAELEALAPLWANKQNVHSFIDEDEIIDIKEYIKNVIGGSINAYDSNFFEIIAPEICYVSPENWVKIFGLLWNNNSYLNKLFSAIIEKYAEIEFLKEIYVPFDAVIRDRGTILNINWLDLVCGARLDIAQMKRNCAIYSNEDRCVAEAFDKAYLSVLIAELTFVLPESIATDREFLKHIDLLDFPGARSREKYNENQISSVLSEILRRGKVAYLFNKYSRSKLITSILFCHHNDQKTSGSTVGETINSWITDAIGENTSARTTYLSNTKEISPLFYIATKFNKELEKTRNDRQNNADKLEAHWDRFTKILPEIIKPNDWFAKWVDSSPFKSIYPLRDFYWSNRTGVFNGYNDEGPTRSAETGIVVHQDYPDFFDALKNSFIELPFVQAHFSNPRRSWEEFATINNDGSKAIIRDLTTIAPSLDSAREVKYLAELKEIQKGILRTLEVYFISDSGELKNKRVKAVYGAIKSNLYLSVASNPEIFGLIIDKLMVHPSALRDIAYDIISLKTKVPKDFSTINCIRAEAKIDPTQDTDANIQKLCDFFSRTPDELEEDCQKRGFTINEVVSSQTDALPTVADVVAKHIIAHWMEHINLSVKSMGKHLPHSEEVAFMMQVLLKLLDVRKVLVEKIGKYTKIFEPSEQPNAIADFSSLILNNFVSTVGRAYMNDAQIEVIKKKAEICNICIDTSPDVIMVDQKTRPILDVLNALDESTEIMRNDGFANNELMETLNKLPLWANFHRWENLLAMGLLLSSDISECDPIANEAIKSIINDCNTLYSNNN